MSGVAVIRRFAQWPALRRRRIRIWAAMVLVIVTILGMHAALPRWQLFPNLAEHLGPSTMLVVFLVSLAGEYIDSALGMGYGTTLTSLLLLAGFEPLQIVPCVLISQAITGLGAAAMHHRDGNVDFIRDRKARHTAFLLSALSVVGAVTAVFFALHVTKFWLTAIIAVIVFSVGVVTLATARHQLCFRPGHIMVMGALAAFNKGISGGGYGPLVTAGQVVSGISAKQAVGITAAAEAFTCTIATISYFAMHPQLDLSLAFPLVSGALLSVPMATLTVRTLPEWAMRAGVGGMTCCLGFLTLVKLVW